jgi:endonuclease/exonuclease/phosphatase family metal-dependent hydrolase
MIAPGHVLVRRLALAIGVAALVALGVVQRVGPRGPTTPTPRGDTYRLRILTWNVGQLYGPFDSRASDQDLGYVARVVRENTPDIVALQELRGRAQLDRLLERLGGEYLGSVPDVEANDRRVAILTRRGRRDGGSDDGPIFRTVTTSTGRSAEAVSIAIGAGVRALAVSVHLDAFNRDLRRVQAEEITDWAARQPETEVFLCGDFNFDSDFLQGQHADHPDLQLYRFMSRTFEDLGRAGGGTTILARRIDYIFARTSGVREREVRVLAGKRRNLMDHDPVLGRFEIQLPTGRVAVDTRGGGP